MCHLLRFGAFRVGLFCLFCCIARANIKLYRFLFCFFVYCAPISLFHILETCKSTGCKTIIKKITENMTSLFFTVRKYQNSLQEAYKMYFNHIIFY